MTNKSKLSIYIGILVILMFIGAFFGRDLFNQELTEGDAVEYNNYFVNKQQEVITQLVRVEEELPAVLTREDGNKIINQSIANIDSTINEVEAREPIQEGEDLKITAIQVFEEYKTVITEEYPKYLDLVFAEEPLDKEEIDKQFQEISESVTEQYNSADEKFIEAQQEFAKKRGILLQGR